MKNLIIDQSREFSRDIISRMSKYLSRCKIDLLIRKKIPMESEPLTVNQPSNVGRQEKIAERMISNSSAIPNPYYLKMTDIRLGNRDKTLFLKSYLGRVFPNHQFISVKEAGSICILSRNTNMKVAQLSIYEIEYKRGYSFAYKAIKAKLCLVENRTVIWAYDFSELSRQSKVGIDFTLLYNPGLAPVIF